MIAERLGRWRALFDAARPAVWILLALLGAGVALRVLATASWSPTTTTFADSWPYAAYATGSALENPQHPAGYPWLLAGIGVISRDVGITVAVQHVLGIVSALILYAAVVRWTGSRWAALLPAAIVLLGGDQILLEHSIMSEGPFVFLISAALYAAVRAIRSPAPWWRWPVGCAVLLGAATGVRSAGLFLAPVVIAAMVLAGDGGLRANLRASWRAPVALGGVLAGILFGYALLNESVTGRFEIGPAQGWHLYGRVAPFADCSRFDPPVGTEVLCEARPAAERPGGDFYLYDPASPAVRRFGRIGHQDDKLGAFARAVILNQPGAYARAVWRDVKTYFVPSSRGLYVPGTGGDLDPQLDWNTALLVGDPLLDATKRDVEAGMEGYYDDFTVDLEPAGIHALHELQRVVRFGATALTVCALLCLVGLLVGPRRERIGVLLFGVGGLALLIAPTVGVYYVGRYTVPLAGPLAAGAAIAMLSVWRMEARRRAAVRVN